VTCVYEHPDFSDDQPLRIVRLTKGQLRRLAGLCDAEWGTLDRERGAMSPSEAAALVATQQELEVLLETLRRVL
jgi:hypothetical protein